MLTVNTSEDEMDKRLAVVLGAGPVGVSVGKIFQERCLSVRFVTRSGRPVLDGAESVAADVRDADALTRATQDAAVLVHAVGVPYHQWVSEFPRIQTAVL